jgi:hypothetical protein
MGPNEPTNIFAAPDVDAAGAMSTPTSVPADDARLEGNVFEVGAASAEAPARTPPPPPAQHHAEPAPPALAAPTASRRAGAQRTRGGAGRRRATPRCSRRWATRAAALTALGLGAITGVALIGKITGPDDPTARADRSERQTDAAARPAAPSQLPAGPTRDGPPRRLSERRRNRVRDARPRPRPRGGTPRERPAPRERASRPAAAAPTPRLIVPPAASNPVPVAPRARVPAQAQPAPVPAGALPEFP